MLHPKDNLSFITGKKAVYSVTRSYCLNKNDFLNNVLVGFFSMHDLFLQTLTNCSIYSSTLSEPVAEWHARLQCGRTGFEPRWGQGYFLSYETPNHLELVMLTSFGWDVKPRSSLCHTHSIIHGLKRSRRSCPRRVSAGYKKTLYQACTFLEVGMWPPKRWEIESGHIRISSWVQGERRRRRRRIAL
jgi:hypothetical protein